MSKLCLIHVLERIPNKGSRELLNLLCKRELKFDESVYNPSLQASHSVSISLVDVMNKLNVLLINNPLKTGPKSIDSAFLNIRDHESTAQNPDVRKGDQCRGFVAGGEALGVEPVDEQAKGSRADVLYLHPLSRTLQESRLGIEGVAEEGGVVGNDGLVDDEAGEVIVGANHDGDQGLGCSVESQILYLMRRRWILT